jgi:hypothetical protein
MLAWDAPLGSGVWVKKTVISKERFLVKWDMAKMPEVIHSTANLLPQCVIYTLLSRDKTSLDTSRHHRLLGCHVLT